MQQHMRPFNPDVEDIDMYLEEAKERGLTIPNQERLKQYAAKVEAHNRKILDREEKAIKEDRLKKAYDEDIKKEEEKRKREDAAYRRYLYEFDKKNKTGQFKPIPPLKPPYTGWEPRMWSTGGSEVQPSFQENQFSLSNFDIVVDSVSKTSFPSSFPPINTTWGDSNKTGDITPAKFDITNPYFSSLTGAYKLFCLTGFSLQQLNSTDPLIKSLCNYFVYYWMSIFQRYPISVPSDIEDYLKKNHPIHKVWT